MPARLSWKDLRAGVIAGLVVLAVAAFILVYGRVGSLHGKTFRVYVATDAARGVIRGSEVWLDGQKVGLVRGVSFAPPSANEKTRLVLAIDIVERARQYIRGDTHVQVRAGGSILGDQVVYMSSGTARQPALHDGDTIRAVAQPDLQGLTSDAALATRQFPAIVSNVKVLTMQLQTAEGTLGALGVELRKGSGTLQQAGARAERLSKRLSDSTGTVGRAMSNAGVLQSRARVAMARVDSIMALVRSDQISLGRFRRDSTLMRDVNRMRAELQDLQQRTPSPNGSLGRFLADSAITLGIRRDLAALDSLFADMQKHPLRYLVF